MKKLFKNRILFNKIIYCLLRNEIWIYIRCQLSEVRYVISLNRCFLGDEDMTELDEDMIHGIKYR